MDHCGSAWGKWMFTRSALFVAILLSIVEALADGAPSLRFSPPVARPIQVGRETRRSLDESPGSTLDANSALAAANAIALHVRGAKVFTVLPTGSMRPLFDEKAFVVVEPARYEELRVGDIVTYLHPKLRTPVVHRILEKRAEGYWTKGDHNSQPDDIYVTPQNYMMRVFAIIYARESSSNVRPGLAAQPPMME